MVSYGRFRFVAIAPVVALIGAFALHPAAQAATAPSAPTIGRFGGADRFETAQVLAEHAFPNGSDYAILARGADFTNGAKGFADALAANYLSGYLGAPILLTDGATVPAATTQALRDLKVKQVAVLGGASAVADAVVSTLQNMISTSAAGGHLTVGRAAGVDRYATASLAAMFVPSTFVRLIGGAPTALIARGDDFPDALAAGPLAEAAHMPLILTTPTALSPAAAQTIQALHITSALVLGGTSAVSAATEQAIQALGVTTQRLAGADRQQTAAAIASYAITNLGFSKSIVDIARGDAYPDALSGGPEAGIAGPVPILLTGSSTTLGADTTSYLTSAVNDLKEVDVLGLQGAVSDGVISQIEALFGSTPGSSTTTTSTPTDVLPGLDVPGLGTLLGLLSPSQQQSLLPALTSLPSSVLSLMGGVAQNLPVAGVPGVGQLLAQPADFVSALTALVPVLPAGGLTSLGGVLSAVPGDQALPTGQLLAALPASATSALASLLSGLPGAQVLPLGGLLSAATSSQLGIISQVLGLVSAGNLGLLLNTLLLQLTGLPGASLLSSLSPANASALNSLLGVLSPSQVGALGSVLSGLGSGPASIVGTFLGSLGSGGAAGLGNLLAVLPSGQGAAVGGILSGLTPGGAGAVSNLLLGTPVGSVPAVAEVLSALP